ncbi:MAG TPA: MFS transporter [bacterium]|nr:MFS transporter [bacterium]
MRAVLSSARADRTSWHLLGLLWVMGVDLRLPILAVPPLLALIHRDLGLSETVVGVLTGLPVFLLAVAAILGSLLIARMSAVRAAAVGLLLVGVASALRGIGPSPVMLLAMTFLMGIGIAVTQPAMPALVSQWFATRVGVATAVYANGILVGEVLASALTLPLVLPLVGGSWEWSFVVWAIPVLLTVPVLGVVPTSPPVVGTSPRRWWPDWRGTATLRLGLTLGGASAAYFGSNAFIPEFLRATGRSDLIGPCLTALNAGQLPASVLVACLSSRMIGKREPLVASGILILAGLAVFLVLPGAGIMLGTAIIGFCTAQIFVLTLAIPPMLVEAHDVHRLSAGMLAVAYACSFTFPLVAGAAWDATHLPITAFLTVAAGSVTAATAAAGLLR